MEKEGNNLFQVNLKGMIALLSEHIYSNPNTFVRELLQNCVDAITALRNIDENYKGRIDVFLNEDKTVVFRDNGIGLKRGGSLSLSDCYRGELKAGYSRCGRFYRKVRYRIVILFCGDQ